MSTTTKQALDDAVKAHFSDEAEGGFMVDYIMIAAGVSPNNSHETGYLYECNLTAAPHHLYGLAHMAVDYWGVDEDEE